MSSGVGLSFGALSSGTLLRPYLWLFSLQDLYLRVKLYS